MKLSKTERLYLKQVKKKIMQLSLSDIEQIKSSKLRNSIFTKICKNSC